MSGVVPLLPGPHVFDNYWEMISTGISSSGVPPIGMMMVNSLVMALVLWGLSIPMAPFFGAHAHLIVQLLALGFLCGLGFVLYFVLVHVTGAQPMGLLLRRLRRGG